MKKYLVHLSILSLILMAIALVMELFVAFFNFSWFPFVAILYYAGVTFIGHTYVVKSMGKDPRTFVSRFMGASVGTMLLHLAVIVAYSLYHIFTKQIEGTKVFIVFFSILFLIFLAFETVELVLHVNSEKKKNQEQE